jgi:peptidoglycan/xylan/chitin deacetylase (PgdA/CDA1 family)
MERRVFILLYHHVGAPPPGATRRKLWVTPGLLALHVRFLRGLGYRFATLSEALAAREGRLAAVTFDDGYRDVLALGLPALRALGVPATMYVVTGSVGGARVAFPEEDGTVPSDLASWHELRAARDAGWEIGSHAREHRRLAPLTPAEQRALVERSRDDLARALGVPPRAFAYPYGSYGPETIAAVRAAGFRHAATTHRGVARVGDDPFQLVRVTMGGQHAGHALRLAKLLAVHAGALPLHAPPLLPPSAGAQGLAAGSGTR